MDLLAILFFSQMIYIEILKEEKEISRKDLIKKAINISLVACYCRILSGTQQKVEKNTFTAVDQA